jgi:hypothetical protein
MTWQPGIAGRIAGLEARNPDIMIWPPRISITGRWEALLGDGQLITDSRGARFYKRVTAQLAAPPAAGSAGRGEVAGEGSEACPAVDDPPLAEVTDGTPGSLAADSGGLHDRRLRGDGPAGGDGAVTDGGLNDGGDLLPQVGVGLVVNAGEVKGGGHSEKLAGGGRAATGGHGQG